MLRTLVGPLWSIPLSYIPILHTSNAQPAGNVCASPLRFKGMMSWCLPSFFHSSSRQQIQRGNRSDLSYKETTKKVFAILVGWRCRGEYMWRWAAMGFMPRQWSSNVCYSSASWVRNLKLSQASWRRNQVWPLKTLNTPTGWSWGETHKVKYKLRELYHRV